jgi:hypothetical protein
VSGEAATEAPEFAPKKRFLEDRCAQIESGEGQNGLRRIVVFGETDELYKRLSTSKSYQDIFLHLER